MFPLDGEQAVRSRFPGGGAPRVRFGRPPVVGYFTGGLAAFY